MSLRVLVIVSANGWFYLPSLTYHLKHAQICQPSGAERGGPRDEKVTQVRTVRKASEDTEEVNVEQPQDGLAGAEDETDGEQEHERGVEYATEREDKRHPHGRCVEQVAVDEVPGYKRSRYGQHAKQPQ